MLSQLPSFPTLGSPIFGNPAPWEIRTWPRSTGYCERMRGLECVSTETDRSPQMAPGKSPNIMLFNVKRADFQIDFWQHHVEPRESGMSNIQKKTFHSFGKKTGQETQQTHNPNPKKNGYVIINLQMGKIWTFFKLLKRHPTFHHDWPTTPRSMIPSCGRWALHHGGPMGGLETSSTQGSPFFWLARGTKKNWNHQTKLLINGCSLCFKNLGKTFERILAKQFLRNLLAWYCHSGSLLDFDSSRILVVMGYSHGFRL